VRRPEHDPSEQEDRDEGRDDGGRDEQPAAPGIVVREQRQQRDQLESS
jgi:hypothetical protein